MKLVENNQVAEDEKHEEEIIDGSPNDAGAENNEAGHEQGDEQNPDGTGEGGEVGEGADGNENEIVEEGVADPRDEKIASLEKTVSELQARINAPAPAVVPAPQQAQPMTQEQKEMIAMEWGVPYSAVERMTQQSVRVINMIEQKIEARFAKFESERTIDSISKSVDESTGKKSFSDIGKYKDEISKHLQRFAPQHHSDESIIKDAYWIAKGKSSGQSVKKAVNSMEKNRRIAVSARPASANGNGQKSGVKSFKLTPAEKSAFNTFGKNHFKSEEDYARSLSRFKNSK